MSTYRGEVERPTCGARHELSGALCEHPTGHLQNHRGTHGNLVVQWPYDRETLEAPKRRELLRALDTELRDLEASHLAARRRVTDILDELRRSLEL